MQTETQHSAAIKAILRGVFCVVKIAGKMSNKQRETWMVWNAYEKMKREMLVDGWMISLNTKWMNRM